VAIPAVVGVGAAASGLAAVAPAFPAAYTPVADDVFLTWCECDGADVLVPPSGWALAVASVLSTGTTSKLSVLWRRAQAGDTAPSIADPGNHLLGRMIVVRGCAATGNPWDVAFFTTELAADTTVSIPGVTTTANDCLVLTAFGTGQDVASTAGATAWANATLDGGVVTEQMDNWVADGTGGGFAMASGEKATAGATGATTATLSLTANFKTLLTIALRGTVVQPGPPQWLSRSPRPSESGNLSGPYSVPVTSSQILMGG
jgi:hypothetical protein